MWCFILENRGNSGSLPKIVQVGLIGEKKEFQGIRTLNSPAVITIKGSIPDLQNHIMEGNSIVNTSTDGNHGANIMDNNGDHGNNIKS